jgi:hypothetical protein
VVALPEIITLYAMVLLKRSVIETEVHCDGMYAPPSSKASNPKMPSKGCKPFFGPCHFNKADLDKQSRSIYGTYSVTCGDIDIICGE